MKRFFLLSLFVFTTAIGYAQNFADLQNVSLKNAQDHKKAETDAHKCSNFLLSTPVKSDKLNRLYAAQFIIRWMPGTPDYMFDIDEHALTLTKGNDDLLTLYFAALTKTVLVEPDQNQQVSGKG